MTIHLKIRQSDRSTVLALYRIAEQIQDNSMPCHHRIEVIAEVPCGLDLSMHCVPSVRLNMCLQGIACLAMVTSDVLEPCNMLTWPPQRDAFLDCFEGRCIFSAFCVAASEYIHNWP